MADANPGDGDTNDGGSDDASPGVVGTTGGESPLTAALDRLYAAQTAPRERWALTFVATAVGLALAAVHWGGLLAGGALVGLCWPTFRRALVAGLAFGVVTLVVAAVRFALAGTLGDVLAAWPLVGLAVAIPLVAGPLGAGIRGLVPDAPYTGDETDR